MPLFLFSSFFVYCSEVLRVWRFPQTPSRPRSLGTCNMPSRRPRGPWHQLLLPAKQALLRRPKCLLDGLRAWSEGSALTALSPLTTLVLPASIEMFRLHFRQSLYRNNMIFPCVSQIELSGCLSVSHRNHYYMPRDQ
ncbi:hypothetical protein DM02DRAFT_433875 [Periconia macrospinosa]|uniref:Uncharacterized protein n=1 Tax=Periconia macrospinosa TaxID=97972 RepID=A0A2V1DML1_9PLEO|nr:hypothetical protein DM02DRAFT_433875 [Periconia macrospinosa]